MSGDVPREQRQSARAESGVDSLRAGGVRRSFVEHDAHESNEHLAFLYDSQDEQFAAVVPFVRQGLERGEKCIYVLDDNDREELIGAMREGGIDVESARESGALSFLTRDAYVSGGSFDPDEQLAALAERIDAATDSCPAVRVAVEMTCFLADDLSYGELVAYEERYNEVSEDVEATALCQYNRGRFPEEVLGDVIRAHPHLLVDGTLGHNVYYTPPEEFFDPDPSSREVDRMTTTMARLAETETKLKRQNERLEEFVSFVSHDLRNPLNVAEGHLELAREERESEHLDAVADAHDRMRSLIEDFLALAREDRQVESFESVPLDELARECWAALAPSDATLEVEAERSVRGDPSGIRQLLENLLRNAIEHGGDDVTITIGDLPGSFYVADDGPGIPIEERDRAFESGYSTADDGTGFGLSIVEAIATAHDWSIDLTESEAGGARFEITGVEPA